MEYAKKISEEYGIRPTKKLGQNFLIDDIIVAQIARSGNVSGSCVLEIGPGTGNLTRALLESGARKVIAVEFDKNCLGALKEMQRQYSNLEIVNCDAITFNEEGIGGNLKVVANLPYNIGTGLILKWIKKIELFESITVLLQKEVADRIAAKPKTSEYGSLSLLAQYGCYVEKLFDIMPESFWPKPRVISSLIQLIPYERNVNPICTLEELERVAKIAFSQKRKMIRKNFPKELLSFVGIDETSRAEELDKQQFYELAKEYSKIMKS